MVPATVDVLSPPPTRPDEVAPTLAAPVAGAAGTLAQPGQDLASAATVLPVDTSAETPLARPAAAGVRRRAAALEGTVVAGRFKVGARIGAGGMGTVYLAEQTAVNRKVVLKFLHPHLFNKPDLIERFHREALAASKLTCPNTIVLYDFGQTGAGMLYMAMEYLEGRPLADLIASAGALPALRAIGITLQILSSLEEAHEKGIVHRDLKPENIMLVNRSGTTDFVKVLDFGIAKLMGEGEIERRDPEVLRPDQSLDRLTRDGAICGSPGYMAPEQVLSEAVDHRADIYAVGVILYEMLSGKRPFQGKNLLDLVDHATEGKIDSLCDTRPDLALPRRLDRLVLSCLHKDPDARPASAAALTAALRQLTPEVARQQQDQERALMELVGIRRRWTRHLRWIAPAVAALSAVGLVILLLVGRGGGAEGTSLAPGERVLVAASTPRVPSWVEAGRGRPVRGGRGAPDGVRGEARDRASRETALKLALAEVLAGLADVPPRFDREQERGRYDADLLRVHQVVQGEGSAPLLRGISTYWTKVAVGSKQGEAATYRYDAYAHARPLPEELSAALRRLYAELRYDRYSFLTDEAVRRKDCARAAKLSARVEEAIADLDVKKAKRARLRFVLKLRMKCCLGRPVDAGAPASGDALVAPTEAAK
jgi:tRNA A-37 threonylcarbamoyl transferase component Bud32